MGVLWAVGVSACLACAVASGSLGVGAGLGWLLAAGALWLGGLDYWADGPKGAAQPGGLLLILLLGVGLRGVVAHAPLELSDDVYRYVWEGDLVAQGQSPYAYAPDAPEHAEQRERLSGVFERMNHQDVSAAYPIAMQLASAAALAGWDATGPDATLAGVRRMRWFFGLCDLAVLLPLGYLLRRRGLSGSRALAWAACPLAAIEFAGSGHFDSLGILCLVGGLACLPDAGHGRVPGRAREGLGMALFTAAVWIKLLPCMLLPFVLRGAGWGRRLGVFGMCSLAFHVPVLGWESGAQGGLRGLAAYGSRWEGGSLVYRWVVAAATQAGAGVGLASGLGRALAVGALLGGVAILWRKRVSALDAALPLLAIFAVFTPMLHPWYLCWLVPFLALQRHRGLAWLLAAAPLLYVPLQGYRDSGVWHEPVWTWALLMLPFLGLSLWDRRGQRP